MIDIHNLRTNPDIYKAAVNNRCMDVCIDSILSIDTEWKDLIQRTETLQNERNIAAKNKDIENGKRINKELEALENALIEVSQKRNLMLYSLPNIPFDSVPIGKNEDENVVREVYGTPKTFDFVVRDHTEIGEITDTIDIEKARISSGSRFAYLKNKGALLHFALQRMVMDMALRDGFEYILPPMMIRSETYHNAAKGSGDAHSKLYAPEMFTFPDDNLILIGTAEHALAAYHSNETLEEGVLPKRYIGYSSCFRREAGSAGKDTRGILRVHQFEKLEYYIFCTAEQSKEEHKRLLNMQHRVFDMLEIPHRLVELCTGDMPFSDASAFDFEAWIPSQNTYRELTSGSNCTDFQARRLNTKVLYNDGKKALCHTLNATGLALQRAIIAIYENYQQADGSVKIPTALIPYTGFDTIEAKK